jgi:hypothetical protein
MPATVNEPLRARDRRLAGSTLMAAHDAVNYLAVLVRLASLDGLHLAEEEFLDHAAASLGLGAEMARRALDLVSDRSTDTKVLVERIHDRGLRLHLLRDAYQLAAADGSISDGEIHELSAIAQALGIGHSSAMTVKAIALQETRLQREFAQLVEAART